jgi:hypothetical protein
MGDFRARDADRDRYVEVIETAYVDGQLGEQDRELRVGRALAAETLDELEALTRDLQNRPAQVAVAPVPAAAPRSPARATASADSSSAGKAVGLVVAALVGLVFIGAVSSMHSAQEDWASSTDYAEVPWEQAEAATSAPGFSMTNRGVRELVGAYEAEFGTREAHEVVLYPRRVVVLVPMDANRPTPERWLWDGAWSQVVESVRIDRARPRVDLGSIDARRLVENIRTARGALRVEDGRFSRAVLTRQGEDAVLEIHVSNQFNESGSLTTTPDGEILRRQPYEG